MKKFDRSEMCKLCGKMTKQTKEKIIDENGLEIPNPFYDPAFKEKRKESAKKYYLANREKVLARMASKKESSDSE